MAIQQINIGSSPKGEGGDTWREGSEKINGNFQNLDERTTLAQETANSKTANATDAHLLSRSNHTGTQPISTISGLQAALDSAASQINITGNAATATSALHANEATHAVSSDTADSANHAATAGKLATPRKINGIEFDGSADITVVDSSALAKASNLSDLKNKTTARTNLDVYSKSEVNAILVNIELAYMPIPYPKSTPPPGYLALMGQAISQATYPLLYSLYGATLPDLRGQFLRGLDYGRGIDAGRVALSEQADAIKAHTHTYSAGSVGYNVNGGSQTTSSQAPSNKTTGSTGDDETRPKNIAFLYIVKAG